jgi:hypothetical protein
MIRIDEIYNNIFLNYLQRQNRVGLHWFEPFGTSEIENICNLPKIDGNASHRIIMWDQEVLHRDRAERFFDSFLKTYQATKFTLITSESDSEDVDYICNTYGLQQAYYFFHGWAALDWYRGYDHTFLSVPFAKRTIEKTFLCPNNIVGGARIHRLRLLSELVDRELIENNFISFPDRCPYEGKTVAELCKAHDIDLASVDLPLIIDRHDNHANHSHRIDMWAQANQSLLQVVTETVYQGRKLHLTEKTFKPIVMQQPFVLVSTRGSLEYLRRYGFKTFAQFWDESYDECDDNVRIMKIAKLLKDLDGLSENEKRTLQKHLAPIVEYNFEWFYSRLFEKMLWKELTKMLSIL